MFGLGVACPFLLAVSAMAAVYTGLETAFA